MKPTRGLVFLKPIDEIKPEKPEMGFGSKLEKLKPEQPYKFEVLSVGDSLPVDGVFVPAEVKPGDIVSLVHTNQTMRERIAEQVGFYINDLWIYPVDFRDILGVWSEDEKTDISNTTDIDNIPGNDLV